MSDAADMFDAGRIQVIEGLEAIRKRPGMYVGSTSQRGLHQMVFEALNPAVHEVLMRGAGSVDVTLTSDGGVRVADDGPGVPFESAGDAAAPGLEAQLTSLYAGWELGGHRGARRDLFGIGLSTVNALSSRLIAEVRREGVREIQEHARGVALTPPTPAGPATGSGTTLAFWPDADIFETTECSYDVLAECFRELAFLNRGLRMSLTDERPPGGAVTERFEGGVRDFVAFLETDVKGEPAHPDILDFEVEDPRMAGSVEVALRWCDSRDAVVRSFANSRRTHEGGEHVEGFRAGLAAALTAYARERRLLTAADPGLDADSVGEGLTAVVSVKLDRPEFHGATRTLLAGAEVRSCVEAAVRDHVGTWLERHPEQASAVVHRIVRGAGRD
ncbi:ATP-binding protein [Streptomyces sp. NBC_01077]|uniref:ATP-binding protein n=1 Tax=Streptomyces sp. NBC_01077 TaxID=2903746 RepID=UPI00386FC082|nr:ATP-binding protein [Streptomyces sp. NBC_01077]